MDSVKIDLTSSCPDVLNCGFFTASFIVMYEDSNMPPLNLNIQIPNVDFIGVENYNILSLNPVNNSLPFGLSVFMDRSCNFQIDGTIVRANTNDLGTIYGSDSQHSNYLCAGTQGNFIYQNQTLIALEDDNADIQFNGTDALGDISPLLENNSTTLDVQLVHTNLSGNPSNRNVYLMFPLAYSTPCQPQNVTVAPDTLLCLGETYQLIASGGLRYEWLPQKDLSCYDCATPVFSGDSSQLYTVRIWGSDSCSVVRPVMVGVYEKPKTTNFQLFPSECGASTGAINAALLEPFAGNAFSINGGGLQTNGYFANLPSGTHVYSVHNTVGCRFDTLVVIPSYVSVAADFTVQAASSEAPQVISCINQTVSADGLCWFVNDISNPMNNNQFLADTVGLYSIRLEAWKNDPACFDSLTKTISLTASGLTITTTNLLPVNDAVEGNFSVTLNAAATLTIELYDTNGKVLLKKQNLLLKAGKNTIWNHQELRHLASEQIYYRILWKTADKAGNTQGKVVVVR